ncbi:hypothetical protein NL676_013515 [Syzygium grande]|nr:hypothetical protein NL676_013515 [Syzygium grande]
MEAMETKHVLTSAARSASLSGSSSSTGSLLIRAPPTLDDGGGGGGGSDYEETLEGGGGIAKDRVFRPFVAYPDANKFENSFGEETCSDVDEYSSVAETVAEYDHDPIVDQVMPIARLSIDFEDEEGLMAIEEIGDEEIVRAVRVPGFRRV